jgi:pimeloyl-ACP methyl ester carboxylesterase
MGLTFSRTPDLTDTHQLEVQEKNDIETKTSEVIAIPNIHSHVNALATSIKHATLNDTQLFCAPRPSSYTSSKDFEGEENVELKYILNVPVLTISQAHAPWILVYLHGNNEDLGQTYKAVLKNMSIAFAGLCHIIALEYPGFGIAEGVASETAISITSIRVLERIVQHWPTRHILVVGRSIGTEPAVVLAQRFSNLGGLVLISPSCHTSKLTKCFETISRINVPTLVIHGPDDDDDDQLVLTTEQILSMFQRCGAHRKRLLKLEERTGNNEILDVIHQFCFVESYTYFGSKTIENQLKCDLSLIPFDPS